MIYKFIQEPATRIASLETGEIDFIDQTPEIDFANLEANPNFVTVKLPQPGSGYVADDEPAEFPTSELPVRRAMQLASDRQGYIDTMWNGIGKPGCSPLTNVMFGFDPETCNMYPTTSTRPRRRSKMPAGWTRTATASARRTARS